MIYTVADILMISTFICIILIVIINRTSEKNAYNNGVCRVCGASLKCTGGDSQGGRLYECSKCNEYVWITYGVDK